MRRRPPIAVLIIGCLYILMGAVGFIYHFKEIATEPWIEVVRLIAILAGAFLLLGHNWARWLTIAWMAFHVWVGWLNGWQQAAIHAAFLVGIALFLLLPPASRYFQRHT